MFHIEATWSSPVYRKLHSKLNIYSLFEGGGVPTGLEKLSHLNKLEKRERGNTELRRLEFVIVPQVKRGNWGNPRGEKPH